MKAGRKPWHVRVGKPVLERIRLAVAGGGDARTVYAQYRVGQYACSPRSFRRWCSWLRRELDWRAEGAPEERQATADEVEQALLDSMLISLDAGGEVSAKTSLALTSLTSKRRLDAAKYFKEEAEKRAGEMHALKIAELRKAQDAALESVSKASQLTSEQVAEIRSKVLGL